MIKQWTEKFGFALLNIFLSSTALQAMLVVILGMVLSAILMNLFKMNVVDHDEEMIILSVLFLIPLFWIFKIFVFRIIYVFNKLTTIHGFLTKFITDKRTRTKTLLYALLLDIITFLLPYKSDFFNNDSFDGYIGYYGLITVGLGGGVFMCYLFFLLFSKQIKAQLEKTE